MKQKSLEKIKKIVSKVPYEPIHMQMCLRNNIKIYYVAIDNFSGKIIKDDNGEIKIGDKVYKNQGIKLSKNEVGWWKIVEGLYTQEYLKLPEQLKKAEQIELDLELYLQFINKQEKQNYEKQKG